MARAISLAIKNVRSGRGGPFGAIVVKDNRIVGEGTNSVTTSNDPTAHAEINGASSGVRAMGSFQLEGSDIYHL